MNTIYYLGLGKMGANMVLRMGEMGLSVRAYDSSEASLAKASEMGITPFKTLETLFEGNTERKIVWIMVPHFAVDQVIESTLPFLKEGDIVIDGGNSPYKESIRRGLSLQEKNIHFLDAGVSGGPGGARHGACIMVGGNKDIYDQVEYIFKAITVPEGYGYMGDSGAGHFVKMVHNGIEYGMMQAIAEGFATMKASPLHLNLQNIVSVYNHGSVIESHLMQWLENAYTAHGADLNDITGTVAHTGEGQWTIDAAHELNVSIPIIEGSLQFRIDSEHNPSYAGQVLSALRNQFGGHAASK